METHTSFQTSQGEAEEALFAHCCPLVMVQNIATAPHLCSHEVKYINPWKPNDITGGLELHDQCVTTAIIIYSKNALINI